MNPNMLPLMWYINGIGGGIGGYEDPGAGGDTRSFMFYYLKHVANMGNII